MKLLTDTHTHSIFSKHAVGTVMESVLAAKEAGLEAVAITDHFSGLFIPEDKFDYYGNFQNRAAIPKEYKGIGIYMGAEIDIVDMEGRLYGYNIPLPDYFKTPWKTALMKVTEYSDYLIASIHGRDFMDGMSEKEVTEMYIKAMDNPKVLIMGHLQREGIPFDIDEVVKEAGRRGILIELNNKVLENEGYRENTGRKLLSACEKYGTKVSVGSDAHSPFFVGSFENVSLLLEETHFPEELVATKTRKELDLLLNR